MGHMGPLGEEGVSLLGLGTKGLGPSPPWPAHSPTPWGFSPTWGGEEDGTPPFPI